MKRVLNKSYAPRSIDLTRGSDEKCSTRNSDESDVIVISTTRDVSGRWQRGGYVRRTRACICEMVDALTINSDVDRYGRPPNIEKINDVVFPVLESYFLLASLTN